MGTTMLGILIAVLGGVATFATAMSEIDTDSDSE